LIIQVDQKNITHYLLMLMEVTLKVFWLTKMVTFGCVTSTDQPSISLIIQGN
jgi:hypothetical protein